MDILTLITCAIGLSMDAFAISICKGLSLKKITLKECGIVGLWFGGFQALMPFIGYFLGINFKQYIVSIDHWIAFVLLGMIGINMIRESRQQEETCTTCNENPLEMKEMFLLAIASSIDALAVGITFAFLEVNIGLAVCLIGLITFTFSMIGVKMGHVVGSKFKSKAEFAGGVVLILLGLKILLEHLNII